MLIEVRIGQYQSACLSQLLIRIRSHASLAVRVKYVISRMNLKEFQVEDCKKIILLDWRAFLHSI
jgi:hypothetical protein